MKKHKKNIQKIKQKHQKNGEHPEVRLDFSFLQPHQVGLARLALLDVTGGLFLVLAVPRKAGSFLFFGAADGLTGGFGWLVGWLVCLVCWLVGWLVSLVWLVG